MRFADIYGQNRPVFSLEFFPPKKESDMPKTKALMQRLHELQPHFMTVTYGAGGGTRSRTRELGAFLRSELGVNAVSHLTCVGHSRLEIETILDGLKERGIDHVLALRGDPPRGDSSFTAHPDGYTCARDLARAIAERGDFSLAVAGYPENHPDAQSPQADIDYLKEKVDAGAEVIITQLFFDVPCYFEFLERTAKADIKIPIVPGIMPISNVAQLERFTSMCGASIPAAVRKALEPIAADAAAVRDYGTEYATLQCQELLAGGAPGIHLYTLNKSNQVEVIMNALQS